MRIFLRPRIGLLGFILVCSAFTFSPAQVTLRFQDSSAGAGLQFGPAPASDLGAAEMSGDGQLDLISYFSTTGTFYESFPPASGSARWFDKTFEQFGIAPPTAGPGSLQDGSQSTLDINNDGWMDFFKVTYTSVVSRLLWKKELA